MKYMVPQIADLDAIAIVFYDDFHFNEGGAEKNGISSRISIKWANKNQGTTNAKANIVQAKKNLSFERNPRKANSAGMPKPRKGGNFIC